MFWGTLDARPAGLSGNEELVSATGDQDMCLLNWEELFPLASEGSDTVTFPQ